MNENTTPHDYDLIRQQRDQYESELRAAEEKIKQLESELAGIASSGFSRDIEGISYSHEFQAAKQAVQAAGGGE